MLLLHAGLCGQALSFFAEDLTFRLSPAFFEVVGDYYFRNTTDRPIRQTLLYPFPDEKIYGSVSYVSILQGDDTVQVKRVTDGVLFTVDAAARQEVLFKIRYGQQLIADSACYIITTTQHWKQPFEWARYQLFMPDSRTLQMVSIIPDSTGNVAGEKVFYWWRKDFMPERDFLFRYTEK